MSENLVVTLGLDTSQAKRNITDLKKEINYLNKEFKTTGAGVKDFESTTEGTQAKLKQLTGTIDAQKKMVENYKAIIADSTNKLEEKKKKLAELESAEVKNEKAIESTKKAIERFEKTIVSSEREINLLEISIGKLNDQLDEIEPPKGLEAFKSNLNDALNDVDAGRERLSKFGEGLKDTFGKISLAVTGALTALAGLGVKTLTDYDNSLKQLQASTGATEEEMQDLANSMKSLYGMNYGESWEEVGESLKIVRSQLGGTVEEIELATRNALVLNKVFGYDCQESINGVMALMKKFGLTSEEAYNLIAQGSQEGLNKNGDLLDIISEYSPYFASMGLSAEEMFNMLKNGADTGAFSVDKLGDAFKEFTIRLKDGTANEAFEELGLNAEEMVSKIGQGGDVAKTAMEQITNALFSLEDPIERNTLGVTMFGTMWEDLSEEGIKALTNIQGGMDSTKNTMNELNQIKYSSFTEAIQGVGRILETDLLLPLGEKLLPKIQEFSDWLNNGGVEVVKSYAEEIGTKLGGAIEFVSPLFEALKEVIKWVTDNFEALSPIIAGVVGYFVALQVVEGVIGLFQTFKVITEGVTGAMSLFNAVMALNPATLIALAIGALIAVLALLWKNWDEITNWLTKTWGKFTEWCSNVTEKLGNWISEKWEAMCEALKKFFGNASEWISNKWQWLKDSVSNLVTSFTTWVSDKWNKFLDNIKTYCNNALNWIKNTWDSIWNGIKNISTNVWEGIKTAFKWYLDLYISILKGIATTLYNTATFVFTKVKEGFTNVWNSIKTWFNIAKEDPLNALKSMGTQFLNVGKNLFNNLFNGIKSVWSNISSYISEKVSWVADKLQFWKKSEAEMDKSSVNQRISGNQIYSLDLQGIVERTGVNDIALADNYYTPNAPSTREVFDTYNRVSSGGNARSISSNNNDKTLNSLLQEIKSLKEDNLNLRRDNTNMMNSFINAISQMTKAMNDYVLQDHIEVSVENKVTNEVNLNPKTLANAIAPYQDRAVNKFNKLALR